MLTSGPTVVCAHRREPSSVPSPNNFTPEGAPPPPLVPQLSGVCLMSIARTATDASFLSKVEGEAATPEFRLFMEKEGAGI